MELQQELAENALAAGNTTETLQKLVEAAGSAQRAQGETPTVMVTIADHTGVASTAKHTTSYLSPFCFLQRGVHTEGGAIVTDW